MKGSPAMPDLRPPLNGHSLWLETGGDAQKILQRLVDDLATTFSTRPFRAHATLLGLTEVGTAQLDWIKRNCEELAAGCAGLSSEIIGVAVRNAHLQSVFMPTVPTVPLLELNKRARDLFGHQRDPAYMPHWSLIYGDLSLEQKRDAVEWVWGQHKFPMIVPITALTIVDVTGHPDEWKEVARYPLQ